MVAGYGCGVFTCPEIRKISSALSQGLQIHIKGISLSCCGLPHICTFLRLTLSDTYVITCASVTGWIQYFCVHDMPTEHIVLLCQAALVSVGKRTVISGTLGVFRKSQYACQSKIDTLFGSHLTSFATLTHWRLVITRFSRLKAISGNTCFYILCNICFQCCSYLHAKQNCGPDHVN